MGQRVAGDCGEPVGEAGHEQGDLGDGGQGRGEGGQELAALERCGEAGDCVIGDVPAALVDRARGEQHDDGGVDHGFDVGSYVRGEIVGGVRGNDIPRVQCPECARHLAQAGQLLPQAVHDARDQELTWTQIGELLGITAATAARRYREQAMINLTRITGIMPM